MTDKRLLKWERQYRKLRAEIEMLRVHIQAQAERIATLEASLNAEEECVSCGEMRLERDLTDFGVCIECMQAST